MTWTYLSRIKDAVELLMTEKRGSENDWRYWNLIYVILVCVMPSRTLNILKDAMERDAYNDFMDFLQDNRYEPVIEPPKPEPPKTPNFYVEDGNLKKNVDFSDPDLSTKDLLKLSIEKWITIKNHIQEHNEELFDGAGSTCALCSHFQSRSCAGCPIREETGKIGCENSPYSDYRKARGTEAHLKSACDEVIFLTELLLKYEGE